LIGSFVLEATARKYLRTKLKTHWAVQNFGFHL
jgi:hypothetical protein